MSEELFANVELNETTILKTIAYLVIQVSELKKENKDNINRIHELEQEIDNEYVDKVKYKTKYNKQKEVLDKIKEYVENLLKEEFEITDPDNIYYGQKCRKPYFSDSELEKILELLEGIE